LNRLAAILLAGLLPPLAASAAEPEPACTIAGLDWMVGVWRADDKAGLAEERWTAAPGDVLMGSAWTVANGKAVFAELMTIAADGKGAAMRLRHFSDNIGRAWEGKDPPMLFALTHCGPNTATFEGRGERQGESLIYRREGAGKLVIVGEFLHEGKPDHKEFTLFKVGL
jgi:hypothetical protein